MPLTIAEALETLPVLASAQVVAGAAGLNRAIRWTHIVDNDEVLSWVRAGDLLLTTAFALKDNPGSELVMVPQQADQGIAGMLVSIGRYIRTLPPETLEAADALGFPIVVIPWEVPLVEVTRAIHERIIREQYELTEQIYNIHQVLSQLVLEGGGLQTLAERLSELLGCSVTIEDDALRLQAHASLEPLDEVRRRSIAEGATPADVAAHLKDNGLFERLKTDPRPQRVPAAPELGMELERIIAPILVGGDLYGYIWIIASQHPLRELDSLAIERAAHIAALILSREQSVYAAEQRIKSRLVENLMDPSGVQSPYALQEVLAQFGLQGRYQLVALENVKHGPARLAALVRTAEQVLADRGLPGAALEWGQRLLLILDAGKTPTPTEVANLLIERCAGQNLRLSAGISAEWEEPERTQAAYQEALQALQAGLALDPAGGRAWEYDRLGYLGWLGTLPAETHSRSPYLHLLEQIEAHDRKHESEYLGTLECYLDHHLNTSHTAAALFIHRNTLLKRLARLQELWPLHLDDPYFVLNLHLAVKHRRLHPRTVPGT